MTPDEFFDDRVGRTRRNYRAAQTRPASPPETIRARNRDWLALDDDEREAVADALDEKPFAEGPAVVAFLRRHHGL